MHTHAHMHTHTHTHKETSLQRFSFAPGTSLRQAVANLLHGDGDWWPEGGPRGDGWGGGGLRLVVTGVGGWDGWRSLFGCLCRVGVRGEGLGDDCGCVCAEGGGGRGREGGSTLRAHSNGQLK